MNPPGEFVPQSVRGIQTAYLSGICPPELPSPRIGRGIPFTAQQSQIICPPVPPSLQDQRGKEIPLHPDGAADTVTARANLSAC